MLDSEIPELDPDRDVEKQKEFYQRKYGLVFLEDEWSLWHIRVWAYSREQSIFGVNISSAVVFAYAEKFDMDAIDTLEFIKQIEREANSGKNT